MSDHEDGQRYSVPPVERALKLLRFIAEGNSCENLSTVAQELEINRTTLIRLIHTLEKNRMIEANGERSGYRLGAGLVSLGAQAMHGRDILQVCLPILKNLCKQTGMSAHLGILDGTDIIYLGRETPNSHLVSNIRVGSRLPAHGSSIGRVILAAMPDAEVRTLFADMDLERISDKVPETCDQIIDQARDDRRLGFAWSEGNFESGIGSCGAVIRDHTGWPAGGINVSGPESRFARDGSSQEIAIRNAVTDAAMQASVMLGFDPGR